MPVHSPNTQTQPQQLHDETGLTISWVLPLRHKALLNYVQERNIDIEIAQQNCKQVHYLNKGQSYYAIGFKNDSGGWELRNRYSKICTSKNITVINPQNISQPNGNNACLVFEGFMDYLSYQTINKYMIPHGWRENANDCVIVLNSTANLARAKPLLEQQFVVNSFLDNDDAGKRATDEIRKMVKSGHPMWDASICYQKHKDLNDYLMSLPKLKQGQGHSHNIKIT
jgi:hypothetical protein